MPDHVVWLPTRSGPSAVRDALGADSGSLVAIAAVPAASGVDEPQHDDVEAR